MTDLGGELTMGANSSRSPVMLLLDRTSELDEVGGRSASIY